MSEFDNLKNEGEQYAKDHPQQVHEAEQDAENAVKSKLDPDGGQQDDPQNQAGNQDPGASQQGQGQQSQQGSAQQDQNS